MYKMCQEKFLAFARENKINIKNMVEEKRNLPWSTLSLNFLSLKALYVIVYLNLWFQAQQFVEGNK